MPEISEEKMPQPPIGQFLKPVESSEQYIKDLRERMAVFYQAPKFKPGDIIVWKLGMRNKTIPELNVPGIVINNLFPHLKDDEAGTQSAYFNEVLDILVGFISADNDFIIYPNDSRRFELYKP